MCQLAVEKTSDWIMVDTWEPTQKQYIPTAKVLDHFDREINEIRGGIDVSDGTKKPVRIALLAGADLIHTMLVSLQEMHAQLLTLLQVNSWCLE